MLRLLLAAACLAPLVAPAPAAAQAAGPVDTIAGWRGDGFDGTPRIEARVDGLRLQAGTIWAPGAHADFVLRFDNRPLTPDGGGTLLLRSGIDARRERQSYAVVLDGGSTRGRLSGERQILGPVRVESRPPVADASAWIAVEARADFDRLTVTVDGVVVSEAEGAAEGFGTIGVRAGPGGVALRGVQLASIPVAADIPEGLPALGARFDTFAELTVRGSPRYTRAAMLAGVQGMARLEFVVETDGRVGAIRVLEAPPHPDLEVAAVACVRRWRFRPARKNGTPVRQVAVGEVMFHVK